MELVLGNKYHGFTLDKVDYIEEYDSNARQFTHEKTGAKFIQLENDSTNKCFAITFNTIPQDSTGVAHILEHSVLCGSKKFPVKAPFKEIMKSSMATFLNAMTGPEATYYPFTTKNEKDFMNILEVYLDAVFYPAIYEKKEILMQEGWYYLTDNLEDELTYKGVVYNEMKGAYSSPDALLRDEISKSLFDNCYKYSSGGDPAVIPNLTQEQFVNFHKKFYHPSNSLIYLAGDMDLMKVLQFVNDEYLANFEKSEITEKVGLATPFNGMKEVTKKISITESENVKEKTIMALNFLTNETKEIEVSAALTLLSEMLANSQESPLWKAIVDAGIGKELQIRYESSRLQGVFTFGIKDCNEDEKYKFRDAVFNTLKEIVKNGISRDIKEAIFNKHELLMREPLPIGYPKPILQLFPLVSGWLQGIDPIEQLKYKDLMADLRSKLDTNYFEQLIEKYILNNGHSSLIVMSPEKNLAEKEAKLSKEQLQKVKESLSKEELQQIVDNCKWLKEIQQIPNSEESLKTIPTLSREDLSKDVTVYDLEEGEMKGVKLLHCNTFTKGITYVNLNFDSLRFSAEDRQYITFLSGAISNLTTKKYSNEQLVNAKKSNCPLMTFTNGRFENTTDDSFKAYHTVGFNFLTSNAKNAFELVAEIMANPVFDKKLLKQMLDMAINYFESDIKNNGMNIPGVKLLASVVPSFNYYEPTTGCSYYKFLKELNDNFEERVDSFIEKLFEIKEKLYNKNVLEIVVVGKDEEIKAVDENIHTVLNILSDKPVEQKEFKFEPKQIKTGLINASPVNYVYKGYNVKKLGYEYSGKFDVVKTILQNEYLWETIRVQGGAYGANMQTSGTGIVLFSTYRDPNVRKSYDAFEGIPEFLENFDASEEKMLKYIIGSINKSVDESPLSISSKAITDYYGKITYESKLKSLNEKLATTAEDVRSYKKMFEDILKYGSVAAIGSEEKINDAKDYFNDIEKLI